MFKSTVINPIFYKNGGIYIKKKNRGKFTDYCGGKVTSECILKGKNSPNPAIRKRATFAANARKWKHKNGGFINGVNILDSNPNMYKYIKKKIKMQQSGGTVNNSNFNLSSLASTASSILGNIYNSQMLNKAIKLQMKANTERGKAFDKESLLLAQQKATKEVLDNANSINSKFLETGIRESPITNSYNINNLTNLYSKQYGKDWADQLNLLLEQERQQINSSMWNNLFGDIAQKGLGLWKNYLLKLNTINTINSTINNTSGLLNVANNTMNQIKILSNPLNG